MPMYFIARLEIMARMAFADVLRARFGERLVPVEELIQDDLEALVMEAIFADRNGRWSCA